MFIKKFLSFVGLLFVGSQITSVSATACTYSSSVWDQTSCSNGVSYLLGAEDCGTAECATVPTSGTGFIYTCDSIVSCTVDKTKSGYFIFDKADTGKIITDTTTGGSLILCNGTSGCNIIETADDGYYKNSDTYIGCDNNICTNEASHTENANCATADVGKLKQNGSNAIVLCLGNAIEAAFGEGNYLLTGSLAGTSVFTYPAKEGGGGNADGIVITGSSTALIYKKDYAGKSECVEASKVILPRKTNLCTGNSDCANYYTCTADHGCVIDTTNPKPVRQDEEVCDIDTGSNCSAGYYITIASEKVIQKTPKGQGAGTNYDLYKCPGGNGVCVKQNNSEIPIGYLPNLGNGQDGTAPLIKCNKSKVCEPVAAGDDCSAAAKIGTVFSTVSGTDITYSVCIKNSDITVPLFKFTTTTGVYDYSVGSTAEYLVSIANDILGLSTGANHFIAMKTTGTDGTVVVVEANDGARYKYTNSKATNPYKVIPRSNAKSENSGENDICKADDKGAYGNPAEYIKHEWAESQPNDATVAAYYVDESYSESA